MSVDIVYKNINDHIHDMEAIFLTDQAINSSSLVPDLLDYFISRFA